MSKYVSILLAFALGAAAMRVYDQSQAPDQKAMPGIINGTLTVSPHVDSSGPQPASGNTFCGPQQPPKMPPHPHGIH